MSSNEDKIREKYQSQKEDGRAALSRASGLEFHYTKKILGEYITAPSSGIELGCATGYYGMYFAEKCKKYVGVDISPENIALFNEKIENAGLKNVSAVVGDAANMCGFCDNSFDVVLALGPMYHLPSEEREIVFSECKRICKSGGIIALAYISPMGAYLKGCLMAPNTYPNQKANEYVLEKGIDDLQTDVFFFATPEQITERAKVHGLAVLKNVGVDFTFDDKLINEMSDEQYEAWMVLSDYIITSESCAGLSNHSLLICRK